MPFSTPRRCELSTTTSDEHAKAIKILEAMPLQELMALATEDTTARWGHMWKLTSELGGEDALYGYEGDAIVLSVVQARVAKEGGGECKCYNVYEYENAWGGTVHKGSYRYYHELPAPDLKDVRGKMCGRCAGLVPGRQDCGYCGRGIYRRGPGGWTQPNRCVGCGNYSANIYAHYAEHDSLRRCCTCEPLPGFKPRRKRVSE